MMKPRLIFPSSSFVVDVQINLNIFVCAIIFCFFLVKFFFVWYWFEWSFLLNIDPGTWWWFDYPGKWRKILTINDYWTLCSNRFSKKKKKKCDHCQRERLRKEIVKEAIGRERKILEDNMNGGGHFPKFYLLSLSLSFSILFQVFPKLFVAFEVSVFFMLACFL